MHAGGTVSLTVVVAATSAAVTFPASMIEWRVGVAIVVAALAIVSASLAVLRFSTITVDLEVATSVIGAVALSVAFAAAWAVGVMVTYYSLVQTSSLF